MACGIKAKEERKEAEGKYEKGQEKKARERSGEGESNQ